ncbi:hypothetical protein [Pseudoalteromonas sp.]|uniref:hypothetical protein n=1 Tax=Pseudoalteromonas sp. TaxID=53249 RepID=UPI00356B54CF
MFKFRPMLTVLLLFAALFCVQGQAAPVNDDLSSIHSTHSHAVFSSDMLNTPLQAKAAPGEHHKQLKVLQFESLQPRRAAGQAANALHCAEKEPEYDVIFEFFTTTLAKQLYLQPKAVNNEPPWYALPFNRKKLRVSGWKDANLLYTAVTSYHA